MNLRDLIRPSAAKKIDNDPEFAVCWDSVVVNNSLLLDPKTKLAYFLQYSRSSIHFVSYVNRLDFLEDSTSNFVSDDLKMMTALMDSLICMARISGLSAKEIPLKGLFSLDRNRPGKTFERLTLHEITVFMWHNIIVCETYTPWFSLEHVEKCDWQGIRDGLLVLFSLFSALCYKLKIDYETLCSYFVQKAKKDKDASDS